MPSISSRAASLFLAAILPAAPAWALDEKQAANNLQFFAAAMNEGAFCETLGFGSMAPLRAWEKKNGDILVRSLRAIDDHAVANGAVKREDASHASLGLWVRLKQRDANEVGPKRTRTTCTKFEESLRFYESKLVS